MDAMKPRLHSLRSKILLYVALPIAVILAAGMAYLAVRRYEDLTDFSHLRLDLAVSQAATQLDKANLRSVTVAKTMALAQENGLFGKRADSIRYARKILESNPELTGAYFGYEPDADGHDRAFLESATPDERKACDDSGRFLPYWFRDKTDPSKIILTPLIDMETSFYYQGVKNRVRGEPETAGVKLAEDLSRHYAPVARGDAADEDLRVMITEPYIYEGKLIFEQTYPIMIDGRFAGIAGVDRALTDVHKELRAIKPFETAEFILISKRGRVIASTFDDKLNALPIEDTAFGELLLSFYQMDPGSDSPFLEHTSNETTFLYHAARIPFGQWTLILRVDGAEIFGPIRETLAVRFSMGLLALGVIVAILWWLARSISGRIASAAELAGDVARGDLTSKVEVTGKDETGQLLSSLKTMMQNLNGLVGQVKRSSIQLTSTATSIAANARKQETAVQEFGSSANEIAASVNEISATSQELNRTMKEVNASANETAELADSGQRGLEEMRSAMEGLVEANRSISSKLSVINERALKINDVVTTINKVADQTNLLSLNAAIEAEKAGEYGRGFSVVAREIRRLADQTAVATLDIDRMVRDMQSAVSAGVMEMDKFTDQIRRGVADVGQIGQQLGSIIEHVQTLTTRFEAVQEGMNAQTEGAQQISTAMTQLTRVARASSDAIATFNQATRDLHEAVKELGEEIRKFRTTDDGPEREPPA